MNQQKIIKCAKCGEYHFDDEDCKPAYKVWEFEEGREWSERCVRATSFEEAAEKWAKVQDQDDYTLAFGETMKIGVECPEGEISYYEVSGRMEPVYKAEEFHLTEEEKEENGL